MTIQPVHDRLDRRPTWIVQGVFDPDVTGHDFSYTIGLHDRGLPELHLWANPTEGADPGEDWKFSMNDQCGILNRLAFGILDGTIGVGSTIVEKYDDGLATVTFRIRAPGDREALEAFGIAPGAEVLPIGWSLERPAPQPLARMERAAERAAFDEYATLVASLPTKGGAPSGWELPSWPSFDEEQVFGPRTPVVLARAAQLWTSSDLGGVVCGLVPFGVNHSLSWQVSVARTLGRQAGRSAVLEHLEKQTYQLVDHLIEEAGARWTAALLILDPDIATLAPDDRTAVEANARDWLRDATLAVLSTEAVADLIDQRVLLAARGPWLATLRPSSALPGPEWTASPGVIRAVRKQLRPLSMQQWNELVGADRRARDADGGESAYNDMGWRLSLLFQTTAAGCPWSKLADLPAGREVRQVMWRGQAWESMVEWASCLAALLTHRALFTSDEVEAFVEPVRHLLPDLQRVVDALR